MQRMCSFDARVGLAIPLLLLIGVGIPARADLIRTKPGRSFPDIAGDIMGSQTYRYDPATQTGTFALVNAPHLISLGPSPNDLFPMQPEKDGTLSQSLRIKLDREGHLLPSQANQFVIRGSVRIGERIYEGILLEGTPKAFGVSGHQVSAVRNSDVFDLNVKITGGKLADQFGSEAHLRITPPANSTFHGRFTDDFSDEKPLTNLRSLKEMPTTVPEPTPLWMLLTFGAGTLAYRLRRRLHKAPRRRLNPSNRETSLWVSPNASHDESVSLQRGR